MNWPDIPSEKEIAFSGADTDLPKLLLEQQEKINTWLQLLIQKENKPLQQLLFVFCSDEYLHRINVEYLQHDTYTDIITFSLSETAIDGEIYISLDRIRENAQLFKTTFEQELLRVMAHGVLHLLGYKDKTEKEQKQMRQKEEEALEMFLKRDREP